MCEVAQHKTETTTTERAPSAFLPFVSHKGNTAEVLADCRLGRQPGRQPAYQHLVCRFVHQLVVALARYALPHIYSALMTYVLFAQRLCARLHDCTTARRLVDCSVCQSLIGCRIYIIFSSLVVVGAIARSP